MPLQQGVWHCRGCSTHGKTASCVSLADGRVHQPVGMFQGACVDGWCVCVCLLLWGMSSCVYNSVVAAPSSGAVTCVSQTSSPFLLFAAAVFTASARPAACSMHNSVSARSHQQLGFLQLERGRHSPHIIHGRLLCQFAADSNSHSSMLCVSVVCMCCVLYVLPASMRSMALVAALGYCTGLT